MNVKANIILLINSKNRVSKRNLRNSIGVKDSYIQSSVKWYNSFSDKKICYDNDGYYFRNRLTTNEIEHLKKYITITQNIQVIFYILVKSLSSEITNYNTIEYQARKYSISTLNSVLKYLKLPTVQEILKMNSDLRLYYCSILPLYYFEGEIFLEDDYIEILKSLYRFDTNMTKRYITSQVKILEEQINSTFISNHQRLVISTLFLLSFLHNGQVKFTLKEVNILDELYIIPSVISKKLFNSIFVFESDFLFEKYTLKSYEEINLILKSVDQLEFLKIKKGYLEPCLDKFPLYNACIYQCVKSHYSKKGCEEYIYTKIANILIAIWLKGVQNISSYNLKKTNKEFEVSNLIYKSNFSDYTLYASKSGVNEIYEFGGNIYIEYKCSKSYFNLSRYIAYNNVMIQSFDAFDIHISEDVPFYFVIDCLKRLELNYPNIIIKKKKFGVEILKHITCYSFISNSKYKTFPIVVNNDNYELQEIHKKIK